MIEALLDNIKNIDNVELIMLGGSRAVGEYDETSDYDIYVYAKGNIPLKDRQKALAPYFQYIEWGNQFWEEEDDGILINGQEVEIIYRDIRFINDKLNDTFVEYKQGYGYSTCFIFNILKSVVIYDKHRIMPRIKDKYNDYPQSLKNRIINENIQLIDDKMPSLLFQIEKAVNRGDLISINHRLATYLEIYIDILFAINEQFHPGEKRLLKYIADLPIKPENIENNIKNILLHIFSEPQKSISLLHLIYNQLNDSVSKNYLYEIGEYKRLKACII